MLTCRSRHNTFPACLPPVLLLALLLWNVHIALFSRLSDLYRHDTAVHLALEKPLKAPEFVCFKRAHTQRSMHVCFPSSCVLVCLALAW